ncbi:MAG: methyl-accepting chemotaxis protein [Oscillospiraceae bacterium]|nr:methyl-accepting chemotaxis protein [Oscillospiraceae bacterium]
MKSLKVSAKLCISFAMIIAFSLVASIAGIVGMRQIAVSGQDVYYNITVPMPQLAYAERTLLVIRIHVREMVMASMTDDFELVETEFGNIVSFLPHLENYMDTYRELINYGDQYIVELFDEARMIFETDLVPVVLSIYDASQRGDIPAILTAMEYCRYYSDIILDKFEESFQTMTSTMTSASHYTDRLFTIMSILIIAMLVVSTLAAVLLTLYMSDLISKPLIPLAKYFKKAARQGEITFTPEEKAFFVKNGERRDEIGNLSYEVVQCMEEILGEIKYLEKIADGDLTVTPNILSEDDVFGTTLVKMVDKLNSLFGDINESSKEVTAGATQMAEGSQSLAKGSSEQAASVQELTATIVDVEAKTKDNASKAEQAAALAGDIKLSAQKGSVQMNEMVGAVSGITEASRNIEKVIKVIDDIAFQTNILALNAAVEAARAGQHGKGFAVVAEEVRNLASKSAEAAQNTGSLIADSVSKAELGAKIAEETAESLTEIVAGINESSSLVEEISNLSKEQSLAISQINQNLEQVADVIQATSATAEQSAASSEEMSAQSQLLNSLVARFKLK